MTDHNEALRAIYDQFCAMDNQDVPLEEYPQRAIDALARAGYAVVPCNLPHEVLGQAAIDGIFETGNPKHGWDILLAKTRIGPSNSLAAPSPGEGVPEGMVLVPREATDAMLRAGAPEVGFEQSERYAMQDAWKAMLAAAPAKGEGK